MVARMRPPGRGDRRCETLGRLLAVSASLAALVGAYAGLRIGIPRLDDARAYWAVLAPEVSDDPVAHLYGFDEPVWIELRDSVGAGDRYAVVAEGEGQHEIRNYAAYSLLPGIQVSVSDLANADVVIYYDVPPPATGCVPVGKNVCIVRRTT
jgi:hypothetical protein